MLLNKLSEVLPNLPLPQSLSLPQTSNTSNIVLSANGSGAVSSNVADDFSGMPSVTPASYPSTELIRRLAAQTGAQLPFNTSQQTMIPAPTSQIEDLSMYDSSHSTTHSSGSGARSNSATPGPYEPTMAQSRSQIVGHSTMQIPTSHSQHNHLQNHHVGVNPTAYDPRFAIPGYPVDPNMMFKP